jgi:phosphotransferase system enzyme I (PtsI)
VAILARALGLPGVVGLKNISLEVSGDDTVIIDGYQGIVVIRPDRATLERYRDTEKRHHRAETDLAGLRSQPAITADGVRITVLGNIEFPHEVDDCLKNGADGIGLYRTEYLYLGRDEEPTEEDHYRAYCEVVSRMPDKSITLRTLDLGADKFHPGRTPEHEPNPFLGLRSIRLCLQEPDMFKTQLRAVLRAAVKGNVRIMFPMVTTITELRQAKALLGHVMEDLDEEGIAFDRNIKVGMMVEVPAAAYILKDFAEEVDFFSVGTNDLIQYTLAVDRGNESVASLYSPANPAVLRLLQHVVNSAQESGLEVSICGEMGGDPDYTVVLLGMGFRVLSVTATAILEVKRIIRAVNIEQAKAVAAKVLTLDSDREVISFLKENTRKLLPENF